MSTLSEPRPDLLDEGSIPEVSNDEQVEEPKVEKKSKKAKAEEEE